MLLVFDNDFNNNNSIVIIIAQKKREEHKMKKYHEACAAIGQSFMPAAFDRKAVLETDSFVTLTS